MHRFFQDVQQSTDDKQEAVDLLKLFVEQYDKQTEEPTSDADKHSGLGASSTNENEAVHEESSKEETEYEVDEADDEGEEEPSIDSEDEGVMVAETRSEKSMTKAVVTTKLPIFLRYGNQYA